jgi:hypothetical protein
VKAIDLTRWPLRALVLLSLIFSALHGLLQFRWVAIRYRSLGPRPLAAKAYIGSEATLLMVVGTVGMIHICNRGSLGQRRAIA